jgi:hypothetical protein
MHRYSGGHGNVKGFLFTRHGDLDVGIAQI